MGHATPWWDADGRCAVVDQRGRSSLELELIPTSLGHVQFAHALTAPNKTAHRVVDCGMSKPLVSDALWALIAPLLPPPAA